MIRSGGEGVKLLRIVFTRSVACLQFDFDLY